MPINNKIQFRKGTSSEWSAANPVLASGEPGFEIDTGRVKIGNGTTAWSGLYYNSIIPTGLIAGNNININLGTNGSTATIGVSGSVQQSESLVTSVFNETGATLSKMTAVYINGGHGDLPTIQKAIATSDITSAGTYGLVYQDIDNMEIGQVVVFGLLGGINTDPAHGGIAGATEGSVLYLSPTVSGAITTTKPYAPDHIVSIGTVVRVHQNDGVIEVRVQNGFELEELHNVAVTGATNGQFLQYNSGSGLWVPSSSGNFSSLKVNNTGVVVSTGGSNEYLSKWSSSDSITNSIVRDNESYVQFGTSGSVISYDWTGGELGLITDDQQSIAIKYQDGSFRYGGGYVGGENIVVTSGGNVGIGTDTPTEKLTVNGNGNFIGNITSSTGNFTGVGVNNYIDIISSGTSNPNIIRFNDTSTANGPSLGSVSNGTRLLLSSNDSLGHNAIGVDYAGYNNTWLSVPSGMSFKFYDGSQSILSLNSSSLNYNSNFIVDSNGNITAGSWSGTAIAVNKGGTGRTSYTNGQLLIGSGTSLVANTLTATSGIGITNGSGTITIGVTGIPSSTITNFNSSVSGLLPTISNSGDNRILTSTGSSVGINAESNLTFDGSVLNITGSGNFTGNLIVGGNLTVNGTTVTANIDSMQIEDPIITLGLASGNIVTTDTFDRGLALIRATGLTAFMGWDSSASQFVMISSGISSNSSGNYDAGTYGNLQINDLAASGASFNENVSVVGNLDPASISGSNDGLYIQTPTTSMVLNDYTIFFQNDAKAQGDFYLEGPSVVQDALLVTDSDKIAISLASPSLTEISYVSGVTSNIQTQLDSKQNTLTNPVTGTGIANHIPYWSSTSGLLADSNQLVWDSTNNRLGIGTTTPLDRIHVSGTQTTIRMNNGLGYDTQLRMIDTVSDWSVGINQGNSVGSGFFNIRSVTAGANRLTIDTSGRVGIGTATPSGQLHVIGTGIISSRLGIATNSPGATLDVRGSAVFNEDGADNDFRIEGDTNTHLVFVDASADNVGIGYSAPTTKLQVNGSFSCGLGSDPSVGGQGLYVDPATPLLRFNDSGPNTVADIDVNGLTLYDISSTAFFYTDRTNSRIGIGTSSPDSPLTIAHAGANGTIGGAAQTQIFQVNDASASDYVNLGHFNCEASESRGSFMLSNNGTNLAWQDNVMQFFVHGSAYAHGYYGGNTSDAGCAMIVTQGSEITKLQIGNYGSAPIEFFTDNTFRTIIDTAGNFGIGTANPSSKLDVNGDVNIDGNLTFDSFTESVVAIGNSSTSQTIDLTSGTVQTCTLTGNCTFTMPTATAGKSFTMFLNSGSGNYTASFSGVRWADSATPTATITASKVDIYSFISDGTYWYGSFSQNYG